MLRPRTNSLAPLLLALASACSAPSPGDTSGAGTPDAGASTTAADAGTQQQETVAHEQEPNGGTPTTAVNAWKVGEVMEGAIGAAGDVDVFQVATVAGKVYRVSLEAPQGSTIDGWLTVLDTGRGDKAPGEDYVKLARAPEGPAAQLEFVAMGAGHYVVVRDTRKTEGSASATYRLRIEELSPDALASKLHFPSHFDDQLATSGGVKLYSFTGAEGTDVKIDLRAQGRTPASDMDARLFVVAQSTGDWIARDADRSLSDADPLIDAPLTESGPMYLVVDNVNETATKLAYTLSAQ